MLELDLPVVNGLRLVWIKRLGRKFMKVEVWPEGASKSSTGMWLWRGGGNGLPTWLSGLLFTVSMLSTCAAFSWMKGFF